jgi:hypothetical protein
MLKRKLYLWLLIIFVAGILPVGAEEARTALLVGCNYEGSGLELPSPVKDVKALAEVLKNRLGFEVTLLINPKRKEFIETIDRFGERLGQRGGVGLVYFSGHGAQHEGENYLIPAGTDIKYREDLPTEAVAAHRAVTRMDAAGNRVNLLFLDACRNNPLPSSRQKDLVKGLAGMTAANGMLIGFATARNTAAIDAGAGSLYTNALLRHIVTPGLSVTDMLTRVNAEVRQTSGGKQVPFMEVGLSNVFHFVPGNGSGEPPSPPPSPPPPVVSKTKPAAPVAPPAEAPAASVRLIERVTSSSVLSPQSTKAEGTISYGPRNVTDGSISTAWVSSTKASPIGEWLRVDFGSPVKLGKLRIYGAYGKNRDIFQKNSRVKVLRMTTDTGKSFRLEFNDVMDFNQFNFQPPQTVQSIRLEILETYTGGKYTDTPIAEIEF